MIRGIFIFFVLWGVFALGLSTWRSWTPVGAWNIGKTVVIAGIAAVFAIAILGAIVVLF